MNIITGILFLLVVMGLVGMFLDIMNLNKQL